jgi:hypothetical protein
VKAERTKEDHVGHNSGVVERATIVASLDDESSRNLIPITKSLVEVENFFNFCDGYQNLQRSTT